MNRHRKHPLLGSARRGVIALVSLALLTAGCTAPKKDGPGPNSPTKPATRTTTEAPSKSAAARNVTYYFNGDGWPGSAAPNAQAKTAQTGRDKISAQLDAALKDKTGWAGANLNFVPGGPDAPFQFNFLSQTDIESINKGGCPPIKGLPAGCGGANAATCYVTLLIESNSKAIPTSKLRPGDLNHEVGHCFLGIKHIPGDPLMSSSLTGKHDSARPTPSQFSAVDRRPLDKLFVDATKRAS